jgi:alkaline phosphatase D
MASALGKPPLPTPPDAPVLGEWDPFLLSRLVEGEPLGNEAGIKDLQDDPQFNELVAKYGLDLFGGPMLGDMRPRGGAVWLRTAKPAPVELWIGDRCAARGQTRVEGDLATVLRFDGLEPATEYRYDIAVDGKRIFGGGERRPVLKTAPDIGQAARFEVGFGGGARYNYPKERAWKTIADRRPAAFLWLGDNLYIDDPESRTRQRVYYYRRQLLPAYRQLVSHVPQYAIWDDHDFGANDVSGGLAIDKPAWKIPVWNVFRENWVNPAYGGGDAQPGCWFSFNIGDVDFFMTDGRYYRDFKTGKTMLGPAQKQWLLAALKASTATFKVIASGTLWTETADKGGADSWWGVRDEREEILSLIDREKIGGVVLISADRHRADVYQIKRPNGYTLYEFESSKITNNHTHATRPMALYSHNAGNFFGVLDFDLTKEDPEVTYRCVTIDGKEFYSLRLKRSWLE